MTEKLADDIEALEAFRRRREKSVEGLEDSDAVIGRLDERSQRSVALAIEIARLKGMILGMRYANNESGVVYGGGPDGPSNLIAHGRDALSLEKGQTRHDPDLTGGHRIPRIVAQGFPGHMGRRP